MILIWQALLNKDLSSVAPSSRYRHTPNLTNQMGGGPGAVAKAACLESGRSRGRAAFKFPRNEMFFLRSFVNIQFCVNPPCPNGSVLGFRPQGREFRILCLEGIVISFISPSTWGSPGPAQPLCAQYILFISFHFLTNQMTEIGQYYCCCYCCCCRCRVVVAVLSDSAVVVVVVVVVVILSYYKPHISQNDTYIISVCRYGRPGVF